jgi:hypothetical protein
VSHTSFACDLFCSLSLADSFIFLTLTRLVVVIIFENFSFALFTPPPLGDFQGGGFDRSPAGDEIPQRFSAVGPVLRRGGSGEAQAGAGDHGGGANLTGGGLWRPVRGTVAGVRGGDVAGAVAGHNRRGKVVPCDRESVAELRAWFNWTEDH